MKRRNNIDIMAEILRIGRKGSRRTRIVYGANLNFKLLKEYLHNLEQAGLIVDHTEKGGLIETTEKGIRYLSHYEGLKQFRMP